MYSIKGLIIEETKSDTQRLNKTILKGPLKNNAKLKWHWCNGYEDAFAQKLVTSIVLICREKY